MPFAMLKTVRVPEKFAPLFERAQSYVARYFAEQKSSPERGTLEVGGQRYVLVRAATMSVEFYETVKSFYGEEDEAISVTHALLFDVAHAMGLGDARRFAERMEVTDPIARLSAGPVHFAYSGWAFVDISPESNPTPDDDYYLLYDHPYSFESDSWIGANRQSDRPVCVMNAGYSSGWCESSFGVSLVAVEIMCRSKGDDTCRFIMAPPSRIEGRIADYVAHHPELANSIDDYTIPSFLSKRTDRQLLRKNLELERRAHERALELAVINEELKRDIAERKRAEVALSASKELTERLIEGLPGGVVHVDKDGSLLRANGEALRILGLSYDQFAQRYVGDFGTETIFEDGTPAPAAEDPVSKALATGLPQPATTLGVRKPDGEVSWAVFRAIPIRDLTTQEVNGAVVTFFDITERKRFEDKLRHTQKLESLGVLAGGIAHDFNNLLVTILGNASFAKGIAGLDPRLSPLLHEIEIGARRAAELTKQMLDYAGRGRFTVESIDLCVVVREMTKLLKALIPKHVELHYHFHEGLPEIDADPAQLRQVVMNLITNAAEAIGERPGRVVISVDQRYVSVPDLESYLADGAGAGTFLCLEVRDTGSGMSEETRARVFDPFFTTKFKGRGLGMAAVLGIVRGHRGAIRIESRESGGTRAFVLLPTKRKGEAVATDKQSARGTILVVDDDDSVRAVAQRVLVAHGYHVIAAPNGAEGLRIFERRENEINLVLLDVTMPEMSGFEALRRIRARGSRVPVLMSSGYDVLATGMDVGQVSGILEKPYDVGQLLSAVESAMLAPLPA
jgi:two-component system cell cycle sensor histidine kinase/response regulator CckA